VRFEWDPRKAALNVEKHGVSFEDATTVFGDPLASTILDEASTDEQRLVTIGMTASQMLVVLVHTDRDDRIRIISARRATGPEQKQYEEGQEGSRRRR
jgi:uncharacterized DUF497 family protein